MQNKVQKIKNCTLNATNVGASNARPIAEDEASEFANKKDRYKAWREDALPVACRGCPPENKLEKRRRKEKIHFLAKMSIATATLASRIALGLLANSFCGSATKQNSRA